MEVAHGAGLGDERVLVELVGDVEDAVELGHLVGGERTGETELADLVASDLLFSELGDRDRLLLPSVLAPGKEPGEVAPGVEDRSFGAERHGDGGDAGADELDGAQPARL